MPISRQLATIHFSGHTGAKGFTGKLHDSGGYAVDPNTEKAVFSSLNLTNLAPATIAFFNNSTVTKNYSLPGYELFGTSRNQSVAEIPELGNLTNPHWISAKTVNFTLMNELNVSAAILSWVDTSDEDAALQWLPSDAPDGEDPSYACSTLYVGNSTSQANRNLIQEDRIINMALTLDAPGMSADSYISLAIWTAQRILVTRSYCTHIVTVQALSRKTVR
ncbi:hypothetical protein F5Y16DRAFT_150018 [Xylariaceae sp. FL0255]|nr:hypothetical protein F5Y16DRAFT_150018 [Xylariaceae sp. FL0255]